MGERIGIEQVKKEIGYLYYVDKEGYICRAKMRREGRTKGSGKKKSA
jgi:hypothetical protein